MPPVYRVGTFVTEAELADFVSDALKRKGVSRVEAAQRIGVSKTAVTMALRYDTYPDRGDAVRRTLLREYTGYTLHGPLYRLAKPEDG